jgi:geranylgeranyl reductase family protein
VRTDVVIIGGGPAGAVAAARLARGGAAVTLIDGSHPREKPCGGGLTARATALVDDLVDVQTLDAVTVEEARFVDTARGTEARVALPADHRALVVTSRTAFDSALFDAAVAAGADVRRARVTGIEAQGSGWALVLSTGERLVTSFVVGADGANSLLRRRVATAFRRDQLSIATGVYAWGITSREIVIEMTSDPPGYIWSFPRPDHLAIGICAQADTTRSGALRDVLRRWIDATGIARGGSLQPYSWPIPSLSARDFASTTIADRGWITIGDAAGLVDPITREGIFFALRSAQHAADALLSRPSHAGQRYRDSVRDEIACELARAAALKAGFFRPRAIGLLIDALASSGPIRAVMADLIAGTQDYRTLKRRLISTLEIGFAWRWLRQVYRAT